MRSIGFQRYKGPSQSGLAAVAGLFVFLASALASVSEGSGREETALRASLGLLLIVIAVIVVRALARAPSVLMTVSCDGETQRELKSSAEERARAHVLWFIAMRWIAVLVASALVILSVKIFDWLPEETFAPLMLSVGLLAATNLAYGFLQRKNFRILNLLVYQCYIDLVIYTVLLNFSGGVENFLSTLMVLHVIISGVLLSRFHCYGVAAAGALLYLGMAAGQLLGIFTHYSLDFVKWDQLNQFVHDAKNPVYVVFRIFLQAALLFLTAHFVTTLAERVRDNERRLLALAEREQSERKLLERSLETTGAGVRLLSCAMETRWSSARWDAWFKRTGFGGAAECLEKLNRVSRQVLQDKQPRTFEVICGGEGPNFGGMGVGERQRVFQITSAALHDSAGEVSEIVELAQDVTEQKQAQEKLVRSGKLAAVGELAGAVAHEVNNPMAIISAKTSLLLEDHKNEMSPAVAQEIGKLNHLATRVARITQGLLSYCRPTGASRTDLDLTVPIRRSLALIEGTARQRQVKLEDRIAGPLTPVNANAGEMEQVFLNLFLNALDAMPGGGRLVVRAETEDSLPGAQPVVAVVVEDTGLGMHESIRERVFEPFFSTKKEGRGTGLGLPICLGLVRSHGGEMSIESTLGEGTRVTVKLPARLEVTKKREGKKDDANAYSYSR